MHSPFVYNLLTQCLYKKDKRPAFIIISEYIKEIKQDQRVINVKDFGAGSRVFKSNARKVADIAKNAGITKKRAILLNKLTSYLKINSALELGTSVGISSAAIAAGNPVKLTTLEGCPETAKVAREYFDRFGLDNISLEVGSFEELLNVDRGQKTEESPQPPKGEQTSQAQSSKFQAPEEDSGQWTVDNGLPKKLTTDNLLTEGRPTTNTSQLTTNNLQLTTYNQQPTTDNSQLTTDNRSSPNLQHTTYNLPTAGRPTTYNQPQTPNHKPQTTNLVYFDGNHQKEATLKYFELLLPRAHNESVFIFDDIHWSKGMEEAWEEIKAHPRVRVTIDSFFWGIVFFRQEQEKEHFTIRL